ncbi:MAG: hypothetical protein J6X58_02750 [Bacteroidales bacterium]|nr:hypothetical protein [Bacteroidales bacterium]
MSQEEINDIRERVCFGLKQAEMNMLREKALHGDTVITVSNGHIREISAKYLYQKAKNSL